MELSDILGVVGGLALFLYGMRMMGDGLGLIAGAKLKTILEKLTRNRFLGLIVGVAIAGIIQSSNATTVMTVGFVNAGLMDLNQAVGVIIGAKVGTTVTGQLIALKADQIAPIIAFIGVAMVMFVKKKQWNAVGQVVAGLGVLFLGMSLMQDGMAPLKELEWFQNIITSFSNPVIGVLVGVAFTALIQSSSASVGILQAMAASGVIGLAQAAPVVYGMNIGACVSACLASIGGKKDAKRAALLAILFSTIGTVLFVVFTQFVPFVDWVSSLTPADPMRQVANLHTLFNVISMLVLLPVSGLLVKLSKLIIPGDDAPQGMRLLHIDERGFAASSIGIAQIDAEVTRMFDIARSNLETAMNMVFDNSINETERVNENEETVDYLNREITKALVKLNSYELSEKDSARLSSMYHVLSDIERIGDHAQNMSEYSIHMRDKNMPLSDDALAELKVLVSRVYSMVDDSYEYFMDSTTHVFSDIDNMEESIDEMVEDLTQNHVDRLNSNRCNADAGLIYCEILTDLERVSDHALNIAQAAQHHR